MDPLQSMGKMVLVLGLFLIIIGGLMMGAGKFLNFGRLPGDIYVQKGNFTFYFPVVSMILLSLLLTFLANIFFRR
ncbi:hypothetical protein JOC37_001503 [Desulfohalotomaculum tongense]|uniref:DUF2905 domain-containing protein n=1 Tax=Desulforadius tongensis TaxID=1216062 RepID=UPI0019579358|nr:DUF2905 domain-containing protein [Desulforadius tongensis]MBM7855118.1 hypothetical protein [Desulforadius tongensis]